MYVYTSQFDSSFRGETVRFYTGGNDRASDGHWVWSDGSAINDYKNWLVGVDNYVYTAWIMKRTVNPIF